MAVMQLWVDFDVWEEKKGGGRKGGGCEWLFLFYVNSDHQVNESVFLWNKHLVGFGFCLFLRRG